jgi:L-ascorbate metabolism protein UlaG (beta-lactamase superfamily)
MGQSMFQLECSSGLKIVTDPYSLKTGRYVPPHTEPDILTISHYHHDHDNTSAVSGSPLLIDKPGVYPIANSDLVITGKEAFHDEANGTKRGTINMFKFNCNRLVLVHMGDYGQDFTDDDAEFLSDTDILLIPVGGTYTINHVEAADIVKRIKPKIVIPMHYRTQHYERSEVETVEPFLDLMDYVRRKGPSVYTEKAMLPKETEVWVLDYKQE